MRITNRFAAFAIHLAVSFVLFLVLAATIKFLWYPGVLFETEGGWEGIKLIAGVDLIIGPTLTLLVYNVKKPELKRDLAVIGLLQALCVTGGMGTVAYSRPIAVIFASNAYYTVTRQRFDDKNVDFGNLPIMQQSKPVWINIHLPEDTNDRLRIVMQRITDGGIEIATDLYEPYSEAIRILPLRGESITSAEQQGYLISDVLKENPDIRIFDLHTRYGSYKTAVNTITGEPESIIDKARQ